MPKMSKAELTSQPRLPSGRPLGSKNRITHDLRLIALAATPAAMKELKRLATHAKSEAVRVMAIQEIFDRAVGKAKIAVDHEHRGFVAPITPDMTPQQAAEAFLATIRGAVVLEYEAEEDGCDQVREQAQKAKAEALPDAMSEP